MIETGTGCEGPCIGQHPITDYDQCDPRYRVSRDINHYAPGFRPVDQAYRDTHGDLADNPLGAVGWIHPVTGATHWGAYNRPGVDNTGKWPYMPSANYGNTAMKAGYAVGDADAPDVVSMTNGGVNETFDHRAGSFTIDYDYSDTLAFRYMLNYQEFVYYFNRDNDFSDSLVSDNNDTVVAATESISHELRVFWEYGDRWTATTGLYYFRESRDQWYGIRERAAQGRVTDAVDYGRADHPDWLLDALAAVAWVPGDEIKGSGYAQCFDWTRAIINGAQTVNPGGGYGIYCGDPGVQYSRENDTAAVYEHRNKIKTENYAFYTQGDFKINDKWSVTLGVRYSKDRREGFEQRGGYSELNANNMAMKWVLPRALISTVQV